MCHTWKTIGLRRYLYVVCAFGNNLSMQFSIAWYLFIEAANSTIGALGTPDDYLSAYFVTA